MFTNKLHRCSKNWKFYYYLIWNFFCPQFWKQNYFLPTISNTVQSWISHRRKWVASAKVWCNFSHAPAAAWKTRWYVNNRVCQLDDFLVQTCLELVSKELNHFGVIASLFRQIGGHKGQQISKGKYEVVALPKIWT